MILKNIYEKTILQILEKFWEAQLVSTIWDKVWKFETSLERLKPIQAFG